MTSLAEMLLRHIAFAALAAAALSAAQPVLAQGRVDADYTATLASLPIGKGGWTVEIGEEKYSVTVHGGAAGMMKIFSSGSGNSATRGTFANGQLVAADYTASLKWGKKPDDVRILVNAGGIKDFSAEPPSKPDPERVPVTDEQRRGVVDPLTAGLLRVSGNGDPLSAEACKRTLSVFDGRLRYDLKLGFKRMEQVKTNGYDGPAVVCSIMFNPVSGHIPSRFAIKYLREQREVETWLVPVAGTRVLVPFRIQGPTPVGQAVLQATRFVTVATAKRPVTAKNQ